ncbi:MAG: hypothetical protein PHX92_02080 [Candidatus Pacebacteria bacterium]|nr:hypothetical protein [Candidatus Paceibacterota bacterium]
MKKITFLIIFGLLMSFPVLAAEYPIIGGIDINSPDVTAADFIIYTFNLLTAIGSLFAVIMVITAGLEWVSAYGNPSTINKAKKKIIIAFSGLLILLSSYLALNVIDPDILKLNFQDLSEQEVTEVEVPDAEGVYLYNKAGFEGDKLILTDSLASIIKSGFFENVKSIKIINSGNVKWGAILFADVELEDRTISGTEYEGNCTYISSDFSSLNSSSGKENNPPVGENKLSSIIVFRGSVGGDVTVYNSYNCQLRNINYCREDKEDDKFEESEPCLKEEEQVCHINTNEFKNIEEVCPEFKWDIISIKANKDTGILFKDGNSEEKGKCYYFNIPSGGCFNINKYSPIYGHDPLSINLFSLD